MISHLIATIFSRSHTYVWQYAINNDTTNVPDRKKAHTLHPTTGLFTRLLETSRTPEKILTQLPAPGRPVAGLRPASAHGCAIECRMSNYPIIFHPTRLLGFAPDYWALHPITGLFTRLLGFSRDYCAFHPTTGLCTRLLGFAPEDWALLPTTGLCTRLLGFAPDYWALDSIPNHY